MVQSYRYSNLTSAWHLSLPGHIRGNDGAHMLSTCPLCPGLLHPLGYLLRQPSRVIFVPRSCVSGAPVYFGHGGQGGGVEGPGTPTGESNAAAQLSEVGNVERVRFRFIDVCSPEQRCLRAKSRGIPLGSWQVWVVSHHTHSGEGTGWLKASKPRAGLP